LFRTEIFVDTHALAGQRTRLTNEVSLYIVYLNFIVSYLFIPVRTPV